MSDARPLKTFRKTRGWTLKVLGDAIGVTEGQMSRIEREGTTSLPHALKLAELTKLPVETFAPKTPQAA